MNYKTILLVALATSFLGGCGGGGGGGTAAVTGPVTSTETFQLRAAYVNYFNDSRSSPYTISGIVSGVTVTGAGTVTQGSVMSGTFEGASALAKTSIATGTVTVNGTNVPLASTSTSYVDSNYDPKGEVGTEYSVVSGTAAIPLTGRVNDAGVWYTENRYSTSAKTNLLGTSVISFAIQPETASTAFLKLILTEKNMSGTTTSTSTINFRMTPAGALTRLFETYLAGTTSLTMTY